MTQKQCTPTAKGCRGAGGRCGFSINYERNFNNMTYNVIQNPPNYAVVAFSNMQSGYSTAGLTPISNANLGVYGSGARRGLVTCGGKRSDSVCIPTRVLRPCD